MVVCPADHGLQADIIFVIEATAVNGAYINDLKTNYIIPSLEYFSQGNIDENIYLSEEVNSYYGIVTYQASDCLPHPCCDTIGPFSSANKLLNAIDKLELIGGKGESHANIAEGLATTLQCFEELQLKRDATTNTTSTPTNVQKHCILVCNSPPYSLPVFETHSYAGKTAEQLATILQEKSINLSIISPRKIPTLYKLFEKAGGDLSASQAKNYAKDPRHLVLLRGFSLKERPVSPQQQPSSQMSSLTSMPSPLACGGGGNDSPIAVSNANVVGVPPSPIYRPPPGPQQMGGMGGMGMVQARNPMMGLQPPPPVYHQQPQLGPQAQQVQNRPRWPMPPPPAQAGQQRPQYNLGAGQQGGTQGSALIAQLTQPPSICPPPPQQQRNVNQQMNQFGQMGNNSPLNQPQQQQQPTQPPMMKPLMNPMTPNPNGGIQPPQQVQQQQVNQQVPPQAQNVNQQQPQQLGPGRDRHSIWQGLLEWIEKPKNPTDQQKITKHVPCQVSANIKDGEPELKADGWPNKLIMQLMPKQLIGNIGGAYLKNSKSVLFHPQPCEALESLTKVMSSGFAGCVHFTSIPNPAACDIKVLILLYTAEKKAYLGFIPNDQGAFVDRLRRVIQQQKSTQIMRQNQGGAPGPSAAGGNVAGNGQAMGGGGGGGGGTAQMPPTSQQTQGMMISQTNTMTMGGGQITQNPNVVVPPPPNQLVGPQQGGPALRMPMSQQGSAAQAQQPNASMGPNAGAMMGGPPQQQQQGQQRAPFENQLQIQPMETFAPNPNKFTGMLQVERQQNLEKINQLKQTLEAAQQQEQQYKSQLERISHMKTSQLQEALQLAQQTEMKYKILDQQRMANQGSQQQMANQQQQQQQQQQRMMRPVMGNNPGLRHLLQQQPQYRQQIMGMQQMGGGNPQRAQLGQQMLNPQSQNPGGGFDDVSYDFMQ